MKPFDFDYVRPTSVDEVFALLEEHGEEARVLAGGQSLVPTLNMRLSSPSLIVDINGIEALTGIERAGDILRIGALTRHVEIERSALIADRAPLLTAAIRHVAHPAIRSRGTIGGSLALADPAAELPACAMALDATVVLRSRRGQRRVPAADFFLDLYETARSEDELVEAVEIPVSAPNARFGFAELARRHGDYAMVGLAAYASLNGESVEALRLAFFGVANTPLLVAAAERASGRLLNEKTIADLAAAVGEELDPDDDLQASTAMKKHLASVLTRRVLSGMES